MSAAPAPSPAPSRLGRWLAVLATIAVAATLLAAFLAMRSPSAQRDVTLDQRRVRELERIGFALDAHANLHGALPPDLATLARQPGSALPLHDPVTGTPYGYRPLAKDRYRVCATFVTDTAKTGEAAMYAVEPSWAHGVGHQCFERAVQLRGVRAAEAATAVPAS